MIDAHPCIDFYRNEDAVVAWNRGRFARGITEAQFKNAEFATVAFGVEATPGMSELHFRANGLQLKPAIKVPSFSALAGAVVGTDRLALMHRMHAELYSSLYPIAVHRLPVKGPQVRQIAQWHRLRKNDRGIAWLCAQLMSSANALHS